LFRIIQKDIIDHELWKRDLYLQDIEYIIGANIYEYDMKNAGYNLSIQYELLDENILDYLGTLTKEERTIRIGLLMRDQPVFRKSLTQAFSKMRKRFFIDNEVASHHILSIKKDAVFLINKTCDKTKFGQVEFVVKNRYSSFHRFDNLEFYYRNRGKQLDVKGIRDENLHFHEDYMLAFLKDIFQLLETSDNHRVVTRIKKFASMYKNRELSNGFYRELNAQSMYTLKMDDKSSIQSIHYMNGFEIDHSYNYMTYILRLIQRFFFLNS
jgi:hypothetical protein